jgi:hypothetical protein
MELPSPATGESDDTSDEASTRRGATRETASVTDEANPGLLEE